MTYKQKKNSFIRRETQLRNALIRESGRIAFQKKQERVREQESKRAREQESKRAREQESKRAREQESKRVREAREVKKEEKI